MSARGRAELLQTALSPGGISTGALPARLLGAAAAGATRSLRLKEKVSLAAASLGLPPSPRKLEQRREPAPVQHKRPLLCWQA